MLERRAVPRYGLHLPMRVSISTLEPGVVYFGRTCDVSTRGVNFLLEDAIAPGTAIVFTMMLSGEIIGGTDAFVRGRGRVLRVEECCKSGFPIAAIIERYELRNTSISLQALRI